MWWSPEAGVRLDARRTHAAVLASVLVAGMAMSPARAADDPKDTKRRVDAQVSDLRGQVDAATKKAAEAEHLLEEADAQLPVARAGLDNARASLADAQAHAAEVAARLQETLRAADQAEWNLVILAASLADHRAAVGAMARQAYQGSAYSRLGIAMNAQSPDDFTSALAYLRAVSRSERATLDRLDEDRAELDARRVELEGMRARVVTEQAEAADAVAETDARRAGAEAAAKAVADLVAQRTTALSAAEELRDEIAARYREMQAESERLARVIRERAEAARRAAEAARRAGRTPKGLVLNGLLRAPVVGPVTSPFGWRYHPILHVNKLHTGTDFGVPSGTPVRAAHEGVVLDSYYNSAYGNRVVVDHGLVNGVYLVTTYNHLTRSTVRDGEELKRGEVLGYSGSTGYSTGPHLHFETLENGNFVDPMKWLR